MSLLDLVMHVLCVGYIYCHCIL